MRNGSLLDTIFSSSSDLHYKHNPQTTSQRQFITKIHLFVIWINQVRKLLIPSFARSLQNGAIIDSIRVNSPLVDSSGPSKLYTYILQLPLFYMRGYITFTVSASFPLGFLSFFFFFVLFSFFLNSYINVSISKIFQDNKIPISINKKKKIIFQKTQSDK